MKKIYDKLNDSLNDICKYLENKDSFFLRNIYSIARLNDSFLKFIEKYPLDHETIQNHLTYEDVYQLAREIIEQIDKKYLADFDTLIESGELDFSYNHEYDDSECITICKDNQVKHIININREFNYNDVVLLVHEFIHYTNAKKFSTNRYFFSEFLSIYFELFAVDYLLDKGIHKKEIDYLDRIKSTKQHSIILSQYEIVLLAFLKFGRLNHETVSLLQQYFLDISEDDFKKECTILHKNLCIVEENHKEIIQQNPDKLGCILSNEFISYNYRYILGTFLAFYAHKYANFEDVVALNNRICETDNQTIPEVCLSIGINLNDENFSEKLFVAMDEYICSKQADFERYV